MTNAAIKEMIEAVNLIAADCLKESKKVRKQYVKRTGKQPRSELKEELYHRAQAEAMEDLSASLKQMLRGKNSPTNEKRR